MEQYDYRKTEKLEETVYAEIEALSPGQRMQVWESIQDVKRAADAERLARGRQWFEQAVLPALRGFARASSSLLEVEWDSDGSITAALRCADDLRIAESCRSLRVALFMACLLYTSRCV